jgi:hypothetical protein
MRVLVSLPKESALRDEILKEVTLYMKNRESELMQQHSGTPPPIEENLRRLGVGDGMGSECALTQHKRSASHSFIFIYIIHISAYLHRITTRVTPRAALVYKRELCSPELLYFPQESNE